VSKSYVGMFEAGLTSFLLVSVALAQGPAPAKIPTEPELVGTIPYEVASRNGVVQYLMIQVGDGGSGPYKAALVGDPNLKTHTIYRPRDLRPFGAGPKLPVVAYGNGACRNGSYEVRNLLTEIASHGFLVIAIGPAASSATGLVSGSSQSKQLLDAVDWAAAENARNGSEFFGKVDTSKVSVMGQSCGGLQAIEVSNDPRISTTVMLNSGILSRPAGMPAGGRGAQPGSPAVPGAGLAGMPAVTKEQLAKLHAPIAYFIGGKSDIAYPNAVDDVARIDRVPVFMGNQDVGHYPATYLEPRGGAFGVAASAWLKWQLKGDQNAARMFTGQKCGLCVDPKWTVEKKNIE
jgi:hypothetical protein